MDIRTDARYRFNDRIKGESEFKLFNDYYLCVRTRRMRQQQREFKMEVATLNPEPKKVEDMAWHWLGASALCLGAVLYFLYYLLTAADADTVLPLLGGTAAVLLLGAGFALAFWLTSERKWVFKTRSAQYPLVAIPFRNSNREEAAGFVQQLQQAISATIEKKGYSDDDLFAGEMRMLRRLAKAGIISDTLYDSAKKHMLGSNRQLVQATT